MSAVIGHAHPVVVPGPPEMRSEQRVRPQALLAGELDLDQQDVPLRARHDPQDQIEPLVMMHDVHRGNPGTGEGDGRLAEAFDLDPEPAAVGDDEAEIANLRNVDARIVDLVDDPAAYGEPQPRAAERAADDVLGTAAPGGREARCPWSVA